MTNALEELNQLKADASILESEIKQARAEQEGLDAELKILRSDLADEFRKRWPTLRNLPK